MWVILKFLLCVYSISSIAFVAYIILSTPKLRKDGLITNAFLVFMAPILLPIIMFILDRRKNKRNG